MGCFKDLRAQLNDVKVHFVACEFAPCGWLGEADLLACGVVQAEKVAAEARVAELEAGATEQAPMVGGAGEANPAALQRVFEGVSMRHSQSGVSCTLIMKFAAVQEGAVAV